MNGIDEIEGEEGSDEEKAELETQLEIANLKRESLDGFEIIEPETENEEQLNLHAPETRQAFVHIHDLDDIQEESILEFTRPVNDEKEMTGMFDLHEGELQ